MTAGTLHTVTRWITTVIIVAVIIIPVGSGGGIV
jgi:hypothetical protein